MADLRELFEACKTGDLAKVKNLINPQTINARDTSGRKSTPLHFAAGKSFFLIKSVTILISQRNKQCCLLWNYNRIV